MQTAPPPDILYSDDRLAILNKPAGLPSHAGPRGGASAEDWFPLLTRRKRGPWLAHRLDADTAGCLAVALRKTALTQMQAAFAAGLVRKTYWAVCKGRPKTETGTMDAPLARRDSPSGWRVAIDPAGRAAVTDWRVLGASGEATWIELSPRTGRTHQIRVHCLALGCPILGDPLYGDGLGRLRLLARALALPLDPPARAVAPCPSHMARELAACGWSGDVIR
jgi:RluA family pseudouridine synthase